MQRKRTATMVLAVLMARGSGAAARAETPAAVDYTAMRAERAQHLTTPYGWFSLIALDWLKPGVSTVGSAKSNSLVLPGAPAHLLTLETAEGKVVAKAAAPGVTLGAKPLVLDTPLGDKEDDADAMASGTMRFWAIDRGGKRYLRVKDSNAPALKHFHGLAWYAPSAQFRVEARYIPYTTPHTLNVMNKLGQVTPTVVPGYVEFELAGKKQTLVPMDADEKGMWFVFRDATYRETTDGGGRFLITPAPSHGLKSAGTVTLDFNQAVNPPCAYSPFATCPLASPENRLPVPVAAGEKRYQD